MNRAGIVFGTVLFVGLVVWGFSFLGEGIQPSPENYSEEGLQGPYSVLKVIDGDTVTISLDGKEESLRFVGIDAPEFDWENREHDCFAVESAQHLKEIIGDKIRFDTDPTQDTRDKYDRLLVYLFSQDGKNIGKEMIASGFAEEYTFRSKYRLKDDFVSAENLARENNLGIWENCK